MRICRNSDCKYNGVYVINSHQCTTDKINTIICQNQECDSCREQISVWKDSHRCFKRDSPNQTRRWIEEIFNELDSTENQISINKKLVESTEKELHRLEKIKTELQLKISIL